VPSSSELQPQPSPDGRKLLINHDVYASDGQWLATLRMQGGDIVWSDDSRHLCHVYQGTAVTIDLVALDGTTVASASYPLTREEWGGGGPHVAGCSATRGRATILITSAATMLSTRLVQVNVLTGKVETDRKLCTAMDCSTPFALSPDGRYLASVDAGNRTVVEDLTTGRSTRLEPASVPLVFSGDGSALLVQLSNPPRTSMGARVGGLQVVDWRSGVVRWRRPNADTMKSWVFSPPGPAIAVAACEHGESTGVFPSGPCRLDLIDFSHLAGDDATTAGDGLTTAFGWNLS
jgi:hypothetical protein